MGSHDGNETVANSQCGAQQIVCWTRMQTETGQSLPEIVRRKEAERKTGRGVFFWGVGNAPSRNLEKIISEQTQIPVYFSVMKSKPKSSDVFPSKVALWQEFQGRDGKTHPLPQNVLVISKATNRKCHYALQCFSADPISLSDLGDFNPADWRNAGPSRSKIGFSQVTSLLVRESTSGHSPYRIAMKAVLVGPCWIKLVNSRVMSSEERAMIDLPHATLNGWLDIVDQIRMERGNIRKNQLLD